MSIVWAWQGSIAEYVTAGREVVTPLPACPTCGRRLGRWSGYLRWVRYPEDERRVWIRRTRCRPCRSSHALLPDFLLFRRLDEVATIGQVLALRATAGVELRALARRFDRNVALQVARAQRPKLYLAAFDVFGCNFREKSATNGKDLSRQTSES